MLPMSMMALLPHAGSLLSNMFGGESGKAQGFEDAMRQIQQGMGERRRYGEQANNLLNPFYNAGKGEIPGYMQNYQRMLNPNQMIGDWMKNYTESPWAKQQMESGNRGLGNAAAASGMLGSGEYGKSMADYARQTTQADQQNYLQNLMNLFMPGMAHQQGMVNMGGQMGGQMSNNLMNVGSGLAQDYGNLAQGSLGEQMARGNQRGNMMSDLTGMAGSIFGQGNQGTMFRRPPRQFGGG